MQGMAYLGSVLLLHMSPPDAFVCFANLLVKSQTLYNCYSFDVAKITRCYEVTDAGVKETAPKVWRKLQELGVTPEMYLLEWLFTMFVRCVKIEEIGPLWDYLLTEGEPGFLRVPIAVLSLMQPAILAADIDSICKVFDIVPRLVGDVNSLLKECGRVKVRPDAGR